jgi:hypothetical protein
MSTIQIEFICYPENLEVTVFPPGKKPCPCTKLPGVLFKVAKVGVEAKSGKKKQAVLEEK